MPHGVNNNDFAFIDEPNRYKPSLAVVFTVIDSFQALLVEQYPRGIPEWNTMVPDIRGVFSRIPFKLHKEMVLRL